MPALLQFDLKRQAPSIKRGLPTAIFVGAVYTPTEAAVAGLIDRVVAAAAAVAEIPAVNVVAVDAAATTGAAITETITANSVAVAVVAGDVGTIAVPALLLAPLPLLLSPLPNRDSLQKTTKKVQPQVATALPPHFRPAIQLLT